MLRDRLDGIESLRAYAAVSIIMFHLVGVGGATVPPSIDFIKSHFGFGVPLFFVLSGFSLAYGYSGKLADEQAVRFYFMRRFARIAPLFYALLVFQLFYIWLGYDVSYSPFVVLLNVFFVFNLMPQMVDGIVPASWSIGVEMMFYLLLPFLLMVCRSWKRTLVVLAIATMMSTHFSIGMKAVVEQVPSFVYHNFVTNLPYFIYGILFFFFYKILYVRVGLSLHRLLCWGLLVAAFSGICLLYYNSQIYMFFWDRGLRTTWDSLWGVPFGILCLGMAMHPSRLISNRLTRWLGKVSFSLYLLHPNIIYIFGQWGIYKKFYAWFPGSQVLAYLVSFVFSMLVISGLSALTFRWIEQPGMNWGKRAVRATG